MLDQGQALSFGKCPAANQICYIQLTGPFIAPAVVVFGQLGRRDVGPRSEMT